MKITTQPTPRFSSLFVLGLIWLHAFCLPTLAQELNTPAPLAQTPLPRPMRGIEALKGLPSRLPEIAAFHRMTEPALRELFRRDRTLWLDRDGRLFYACVFEVAQEGVVGESTNMVPVDPLYPLEQTFRLHSRPGANRTIYLDFDGHDASTSSWGSNGSAPIARPYDTDGNSSSFSTAERQTIQYVWARVAEDFQQYNINVTTEDPGVDALKNNGAGGYGVRVVIGGASGDWYGSAGGVAYLNSFNSTTDRPCWVFPKSLGDSEKNIAEAASHEAGHTLGLSHDGKTDGTEYYSGQGTWAPIMGVGYSKSIAQWSKGEYSGANNTEDDLTKMLSSGAAYRTDDYGDTIATAAPLTGVSAFRWGVITTRGDVDFFSFQAGAGTTTITATPAERGGNLHILLSLYDSTGVLITTAESADTSSSTSGVRPVTLSRTLAGGTYFISIDGIGTGDPAATGYSDYASLGQYTLSVALPATGTWSAAARGESFLLTDPENWSSSIIPFGADSLLRLNNNISGDQILSVNTPHILGKLLLGDANGSHTFTLAGTGAGALRFQVTTNTAGLGKSTGADDVISAPLVLLSDLAVTNTTPFVLTLAGNISGAGGLLKTGSGPLVLSGTNSFTGPLVVAEGSLAPTIPESLSSIATVELRDGALLDVSLLGVEWVVGPAQMLAGNGAITGNVSLASEARLAPGTANAAGTLNFSNALMLADGSVLNFNLGSSTDPGNASNDLVAVTGDLSLSGAVSVNFQFSDSLSQSPGTFTLMTYGGTLTGGAGHLVATNADSRFVYAFDDSTPGEIRVHVSGQPANLVWQGDGSTNAWNMTSTNWLSEGTPDKFVSLDSVIFAPGGSSTPAVTLSGILLPASVIVSNAANYTFAGSGHISGPATVTKLGSGPLTLSTSNLFTGATLVSEGSLVIGNAAALGATNAGTTINSGALVNLNGFAIGNEALTVSGDGPTGAGAIVNNGASQTNAVRRITLAGPTTFGGSGRWDIRSSRANNISASLAGNNFSLTKTGANAIWLVDLGNTALGNITVNQGTLGLQGSSTLGSSGSTLAVNSGATLAFWNTFDNDFNKVLSLNAGTIQNDSGHTIVTGPATVTGTTTTSVGESATLDLRGAVGGSGGFTKTGAGTLRLAGANTFSGNVTISAGTVVAGHGAALGNASGTTTIASGAVLDLAAMNLGDEIISVAGSGISSRGAIINSLPTQQQNALRFVTLTGNTTFGGNSRWDIRANPTGSLLGAFALTKTSDNEIFLVDLGTTALTTITISEGTLGFQGNTTLGNPASTMTVNSGGIFRLWNTGTNTLSKVLTPEHGQNRQWEREQYLRRQHDPHRHDEQNRSVGRHQPRHERHPQRQRLF